MLGRLLPLAFAFIGSWALSALPVLRVEADGAAEPVALSGDVRIQGQSTASGLGAFHLWHGSLLSSAELNVTRPIPVTAESRLFFAHRMGFAKASQSARVQARGEGTAIWKTLWERPGTGSGTQEQPFFSLASVDLGEFAGQSIDLRFQYVVTSFFGSVSTGTDLGHGWVLDSIQVGTAYETARYDISEPSHEEQYLVYLLNRARADAAAEAARLRALTEPFVLQAISQFQVDLDLMVRQYQDLAPSAPPLAINAKLMTAARLHALDMALGNFQGHDSSSAAIPPNQPGDGVAQRAERQNYFQRRLGENVYSAGQSLEHTHAAYEIDWGASASTGRSVGGMQDPPGHRLIAHNPLYREVGIGLTNASGAFVSACNLGSEHWSDQPFLTGVAFRDANTNGMFDLGEGAGGLRVEVPGQLYHAITSSSGGYALPLAADGTYQASVFGGGYSETRSITISNRANVELNFRVISPEDLPVAVANLRIRKLSPETFDLRFRLSAGRIERLGLYRVNSISSRFGPQLVSAEPQLQSDGSFRIVLPYPLQTQAFYFLRERL